MINKSLPDLSCIEEEYEKAKPLYETALNESGYKRATTYTNTKKEMELAILYGFIYLIAKMLKPTPENIPQVKKSIFQEIIDYIKY